MRNVDKPKIKQPARTELTESKVKKYLDKKKFEGKYVSYITARQFSSAGNASSEQLSSSERRQEYLSDLERRFGIALSFLSNVSNVKTQYPILNVDETIRIASELNIPHPRFAPKSGLVKDENKGYQASIMTTDFLFEYKDVLTQEANRIAVSLKYDQDVSVEDGKDRIVGRTKDKIEIERVYWEKTQGYEFRVITSKAWMVQPAFSKNIDMARRFRDLDVPRAILKNATHEMLRLLDDTPCYRLRDFINKSSSAINISFEKTYSIFWYLIWHKTLKIDLFRPLEDSTFVYPAQEHYAWAW
ncbi:MULTISPECIES: TnsA endonuclease N-terminal domain-containing protein [Gammaproteobacteria]|uniref:TnsA endonuclease N-terminal domain-containing protein n=1 Tax=Gammaproteobacteria TaxID=1236 RepID=UPI000DD02C09|nr:MULTISPECIES: TnsA endonuclease N-terminal domain-containing protein [Gammaproteobacteria]RTE85510.1 hypothetical protein DQX04_11445 [Aliidiomarina sp. B3213]TCZ89479.1 hypothetical protein EYQ95_11370 [Lysobacter sp. N42]